MVHPCNACVCVASISAHRRVKWTSRRLTLSGGRAFACACAAGKKRASVRGSVSKSPFDKEVRPGAGHQTLHVYAKACTYVYIATHEYTYRMKRIHAPHTRRHAHRSTRSSHTETRIDHTCTHTETRIDPPPDRRVTHGRWSSLPWRPKGARWRWCGGRPRRLKSLTGA
jgi:hypothetical protein